MHSNPARLAPNTSCSLSPTMITWSRCSESPSRFRVSSITSVLLVRLPSGSDVYKRQGRNSHRFRGGNHQIRTICSGEGRKTRTRSSEAAHFCGTEMCIRDRSGKMEFKEIEKRKLILENAVALLLEFYCGESAFFFA